MDISTDENQKEVISKEENQKEVNEVTKPESLEEEHQGEADQTAEEFTQDQKNTFAGYVKEIEKLKDQIKGKDELLLEKNSKQTEKEIPTPVIGENEISKLKEKIVSGDYTVDDWEKWIDLKTDAKIEAKIAPIKNEFKSSVKSQVESIKQKFYSENPVLYGDEKFDEIFSSFNTVNKSNPSVGLGMALSRAKTLYNAEIGSTVTTKQETKIDPNASAGGSGKATYQAKGGQQKMTEQQIAFRKEHGLDTTVQYYTPSRRTSSR